MSITGHLNVEREWKITEQLLLAVLVFWWYRNDKTQRQFRTGAFQYIAVVALALVAVPVYLFRSRGPLTQRSTGRAGSRLLLGERQRGAPVTLHVSRHAA